MTRAAMLAHRADAGRDHVADAAWQPTGIA